MEREKFLSSIYLIIKNKEGKILLQRRQGTKLWPGFLALPAGHIDKGENAYEAAIREAKEELGIDITYNDFDGTEQEKTSDVTPKVQLTAEPEPGPEPEPPEDDTIAPVPLPDTGSHAFIIIGFITLIGFVIFFGYKARKIK